MDDRVKQTKSGELILIKNRVEGVVLLTRREFQEQCIHLSVIRSRLSLHD